MQLLFYWILLIPVLKSSSGLVGRLKRVLRQVSMRALNGSVICRASQLRNFKAAFLQAVPGVFGSPSEAFVRRHISRKACLPWRSRNLIFIPFVLRPWSWFIGYWWSHIERWSLNWGQRSLYHSLGEWWRRFCSVLGLSPTWAMVETNSE